MTHIPVETRLPRASGLEDIGASSATGSQACELPPDVLLEDWSLMFGAALERVRLIFDALRRATARDVQDDREADRLRVDLLDCLEDLAQLRTTMTHELRPARMPHPEAFAAKPGMAQPPVRQK